MHCCTRSSKLKGNALGSLMMRFWKREDCLRMDPIAILEGSSQFCKEFHGPGHLKGWEPPAPRLGGMVPGTRHIVIYAYIHTDL